MDNGKLWTNKVSVNNKEYVGLISYSLTGRSRIMAEYIITRASIINKCNHDGKLHLMFTKKERPCKEAYLKEIRDINGFLCSRYFIELDSIEDADALGAKYGVDVLITRNLDFEKVISLVLYDEEIEQDYWQLI